MGQDWHLGCEHTGLWSVQSGRRVAFAYIGVALEGYIERSATRSQQGPPRASLQLALRPHHRREQTLSLGGALPADDGRISEIREGVRIRSLTNTSAHIGYYVLIGYYTSGTS